MGPQSRTSACAAMTGYERTGAALRGPRTYCSNLAQLSVGRDGAVQLKRHTRSQIVVFTNSRNVPVGRRRSQNAGSILRFCWSDRQGVCDRKTPGEYRCGDTNQPIKLTALPVRANDRVNRLMPTPLWPGSNSSPPESEAHPRLLQVLDRTEPAELNGTKDQHLSENLGEDRTKLLSAELFASFEREKPATPAAFLAGDATNGSRG